MGNNIKISIKKIAIIALPKATAPSNTSDETDIKIQKQEVGDYIKDRKLLEAFLHIV